MAERIARTFQFSKGIVTAVYDPESNVDECVRLDHSVMLDFTLDEAHRFYAWYMDFIAHVREVPKKPSYVAPENFTVRPLPNGDFEVQNP